MSSQKPVKPRRKKRTAAAADTTETVGIRGAGARSQASFGEYIDIADLLFAVKREPVAHRVVFLVAHDIFDNWFEVEEIAENPDPHFDRDVQKALSALNVKSIFTRAAVFERLLGWSIIVIGFVDHGKDLRDPVETPQEIRELAVYSPLQVSVQTSDEDKDPDSPRFGLPILYTVNRGLGATQQVKVHFSRVIHLATRLLDHPYKGLSVLEPIYDDITVLRNERWSLGQTLFRQGPGFMDITVQGGTKKQLDDLEATQQFKDVNVRTYLLHNEKTTLDFKGVAGRALNPDPYYSPIMESISVATGIPVAILRGAQAGALTGSEVNLKEYFKVISDAQSPHEPAIRQLIDLLMETGQIPQVENYNVKWLGGFELDEVSKSTAELNRAQADNLRKDFLTINELRARQDPPLEHLPTPEGDIIPGLLQKQPPGISQVLETQK